MKKTKQTLLLCCIALAGLLYSSSAQAATARSQIINLQCPMAIAANVRELVPDGPILGDVLYVHGLGDNVMNHDPLFQVWLNLGYRVIAMDLPSHGETSGYSLNCCNFEMLGNYILEIDRRMKPQGDVDRPLIFTGWSTGGLVVLRTVQNKLFENHFRKPTGLQLFAPGVGVRMKVGNWWGGITNDTLTQNPNPPHSGPPKPGSPYPVLPFAMRMLWESKLAQWNDLPPNLPTQVFLAGDDTDYYVRNDINRRWSNRQIDEGKSVWVIQYDGAFHELDNEPDGVGDKVRTRAGDFARYLIEGRNLPEHPSPGYYIVTP